MTTSPVMTVTDELLAELEESAKNTCSYGEDDWFKPDDLRHDIGSDDAKYVAASSPFVMLSIIAELRRLRAENAELAKDAARLQFVIDEEITISKMNGTGRPMVYQCHWHDCRQTEWYSSIVEAIDTAMFDTAMAGK